MDADSDKLPLIGLLDLYIGGAGTILFEKTQGGGAELAVFGISDPEGGTSALQHYIRLRYRYFRSEDKEAAGSPAHFERFKAEPGIPNKIAEALSEPFTGRTEMSGGNLFHADLEQKFAAIQSSTVPDQNS